ncbi:hypothetical protein DL93DRAFT_2167715 [Clavulina sp. PMI_390]|nr:hypothetical protein DL93DRAFT_2167715 [Clavulina sp. PMI_390]
MSIEKPETLKAQADLASRSTLHKSQLAVDTTITLVRFYLERELWDFSPWVNRLEALLTFSGATFEISTGFPSQYPRSRIPVNELAKRGLVRELDVGLSPDDVATSRAIQSLIEEIFLLLIKEGWVEQFPVARDKIILHKLSFPIRPIVAFRAKRSFTKRCELAGLSKRRPESEIQELRQTAIDALAVWVGDKKHVLGGESPTRADAAIFGFIVSACAYPHWLPKLAAAIKSHPNLCAYAEGLRKAWYPNRASFM